MSISSSNYQFDDSLPKFPEFHALGPSHKPILDDFYKRFEPYADFSFGNLYTWFSGEENVEISRLEEVLIVRMHDQFNDSESYSYNLLGKDIKNTVNTVFNEQKKQSLEQIVSMITHEAYESLRECKDLYIAENLGRKDYIYSCEEQYKLEGTKFPRLRNQKRFFEKNYADKFNLKKLIRSEVKPDQIIKHVSRWENTASNNNDPDKTEIPVIKRFLNSIDLIEGDCLEASYDSKPIGYFLYQNLPQRNVILLSHLKVDYTYRYTYDYLFYKASEMLIQEGIEYINADQDVGIEGLRKHKELLRPFKYLNTYSVRPS